MHHVRRNEKSQSDVALAMIFYSATGTDPLGHPLARKSARMQYAWIVDNSK